MTRLALLLLVACGSHSPGAADPDAPPGGSADAPPMQGDAPSEPDPLNPLAVGHTWHTTQTSSGFGQPTTTCNVTQTVTGTTSVDGRTPFVIAYTYECPMQTTTSMFYTNVLGGDRYESRAASSTDGIWYVEDPPAEGHQWASDPAGMFVYTWHRAGSVTVPAGTFTDCWREVTMPSGSDQEFTLCRGVGFVQSMQSFTTGYMVSGELTAKSF